MKTAAFIQARMGSTRLPGKVLVDIAGQPALLRIVNRVRAAELVDTVVVLTSTSPDDDQIAELCAAAGVEFLRGSEQDVLGRFALAARAYDPDRVVRITGDCPLIDPAVIDDMVALLEQQPELRFASVATGAVSAEAGYRRYPDGLDAEAFPASVLLVAAAEASDPFEREHVTPFIWTRPERFPAAVLEADRDMGNERWTVDHPSDLALIRAIYERLDRPESFGHREISALLEREPALRTINEQHNVHPRR